MGVADPERLGVGGWSYGGILTELRDHQDRRASRPRSRARARPTTSPTTAPTTTSTSGRPSSGCPGRTPERWMRISPWFQVEKVTTPTLVLCGADDLNVPLLNSEQLYQALRRLGTETELVIYPGQHHGIDQAELPQGPLRALPRLVRQVPEAGARRPRRSRRPRPSSLLGRPLRAPALAGRDAEDAGGQPRPRRRPTSSRTPTTPTPSSGSAAASPTWAASARPIDVYTRGIAKHPERRPPATAIAATATSRCASSTRRSRTSRRAARLIAREVPDAGRARRRAQRARLPDQHLALQRLVPPRASRTT